MKPYRRRWYFPGLISLIGLFLLCYNYTVQRGFLTPDYFVKIIILEGHWEKDWLTECGWLGKRQQVYTVRDFTLTGNDSEDGLTLCQLDSLACSLSATRDTFNRARIHFSPKMPYRTFISTIDLCKKNKVNYYYNSTSFYMWYVPPRAPDTIAQICCFDLGCYSYIKGERDLMRKNAEIAKNEERKRTHLSLAKDLAIPWSILFGIFFLYRKLSTGTT